MNDPDGDRLDAVLTEYRALRTEMEWLIRDGTQYQNFAIALIAAVGTVLGLAVQHLGRQSIIPMLLAVPFPFCLLGLLFFRQHEEVHVIAAYLERRVRPAVRNLVGLQDIWSWEEFKSSKSRELVDKGKLSFLSRSRTVLFLRCLLFIMPGFISVVLVTILLARDGWHTLVVVYGIPTLFLIGFLLLFDAIVVIMMTTWFFTRGNLAELLEEQGE